jgi:branched-chain amino acid aminotransferase
MTFLFTLRLMRYIYVQDKIVPADSLSIMATDSSYRYGDGLFETIKVINGGIQLASLHFLRLWNGMQLLQYKVPSLFTPFKLEQDILELCRKNAFEQAARVRLSVSRGQGGLFDNDNKLHCVIECWPLDTLVDTLNENGLIIDVYDGMRKTCEVFSNLKSANFLPYVMAAHYSQEKKLNDCLVLNNKGNIADSTTANVFIVKGESIITPALSEGCVAGVMKEQVITVLKENKYTIKETSVSIADLQGADEVFLTNSIRPIRFVQSFREKVFSKFHTQKIFNLLSPTLNK